MEGNPVNRTDPSGHCFSDGGVGCAFLNPLSGVTTYYTNVAPTQQRPITVYRIPASPGFVPSGPHSSPTQQAVKPPAPPLGWGYQFDWNLGISDKNYPPQQVMAYLMANPGKVFPFSLGTCGSIAYSEVCHLVTPFPWSDSPVQVSSMTDGLPRKVGLVSGRR